jgi:hypothetical protein
VTDRLVTADASNVSGADFLRALRGLPPLTAAERAEKERQAAVALEERKRRNRAELEQVRDNLCKLASPELAAKFRAKWAEEDAADERREQLRKAA